MNDEPRRDRSTGQPIPSTPDPLASLDPGARHVAVLVAIDTDSIFVSRKRTALAVDEHGNVWHIGATGAGTLIARKVERG